jgi:hypothetical protein
LWEKVQLKDKNPDWAAIEDLETPPEDMSVQEEIYLPVNQNKSLTEKSLKR